MRPACECTNRKSFFVIFWIVSIKNICMLYSCVVKWRMLKILHNELRTKINFFFVQGFWELDSTSNFSLHKISKSTNVKICIIDGKKVLFCCGVSIFEICIKFSKNKNLTFCNRFFNQFDRTVTIVLDEKIWRGFWICGNGLCNDCFI